MPGSYKVHELMVKVSEEVGLKNYIEFRFYECDESLNIVRQLMEDELICENKSKNYFGWKKKKHLVLRKYLFLSTEYEEYQEMIEIDYKRLSLIVNQLFSDIKKRQYVFVQKDYYVFAALQQIIEPNNAEWGKTVPGSVVRSKSKTEWQMFIHVMKQQILQHIPSFISYQLTVQEIKLAPSRPEDPRVLQELASTGQKIASIEDSRVQACKLLIELMRQHPFYGVTFFNVGVSKDTQDAFTRLVASSQAYTNVLLGVSCNGLHLVHVNKQVILGHLGWNEYRKVALVTGNVVMQVGNDTVEFTTNQGYSIISLIEEYEYLAEQLHFD